jgi:hypothetical protein
MPPISPWDRRAAGRARVSRLLCGAAISVAGRFRTPRHIIRLMVEMTAPVVLTG